MTIMATFSVGEKVTALVKYGQVSKGLEGIYRRDCGCIPDMDCGFGIVRFGGDEYWIPKEYIERSSAFALNWFTIWGSR